ncbi:MAG: alginate export family protein [Endomicrobium sp.]|nr:alginate export family protein [Endomicrobium sp.]
MKFQKIIFSLAGLCIFSISSSFAAQLAFDGQTRLRYEYLGNNSALTDERASYFRFRFSGGVKADFSGFASLYGKLTTESRSYIYNSGRDAVYNADEAVIDNFFIFLPDIKGFEIKAGRFDLNPQEYGEGFLFADGTPLDGSRTSYFNALRLRYNNIEFLGIYNTKQDELPVINNRDKLLNSSTETAAVIYARFKKEGDDYGKISEISFEPYYIYKEEADIADINTLGTYFKYAFNKFALRAQAAFQTGKYGGKTKNAFGGYIFGDLPIADFIKSLSFGYIYLSGADENGGASWNPLFSRYPWQSEIMATLYGAESGAGYWTNLQLLKASAAFAPFNKTAIEASYNYLLANNTVSGDIFGSGKERGHLAVCRISYAFSKEIKTYIHGEYFIPGNFYKENAKNASFLRLEISAKI